MKLTRCYSIPPLYDLEVELDVELRRTFSGATFVVIGMQIDGYDIYDHPIRDQAPMFLQLAYLIEALAEADETIMDELLEEEAREAA